MRPAGVGEMAVRGSGVSSWFFLSRCLPSCPLVRHLCCHRPLLALSSCSRRLVIACPLRPCLLRRPCRYRPTSPASALLSASVPVPLRLVSSLRLIAFSPRSSDKLGGAVFACLPLSRGSPPSLSVPCLLRGSSPFASYGRLPPPPVLVLVPLVALFSPFFDKRWRGGCRLVCLLIASLSFSSPSCGGRLVAGLSWRGRRVVSCLSGGAV